MEVNNMKTALLFSAFVVAAGLTAADFRIDVAGLKGVGMAARSASDGVTVRQAEWMKERKDQRLVASVKVSNEWKEYSFTFVPKKTGNVQLNLMSNSVKDMAACDGIRVSGSTLKNGGFEEVASSGKPSGWQSMKAPRLVTDGKAGEGKNFVQVAHNDRWFQIIPCKEGEAVTVTFLARNVAK